MGATGFLDAATVTVEPGQDTSCELKVRNSGDVVDQFTLDVVGDAEGWTVVEPKHINLLPSDEATVRVTFSPPRSSDVRAGPVSFGVRVRSREEPQTSFVEEGEVEVARFVEIGAELVPATRRGRRRAKYQLLVDNFGNVPTEVELSAVYEDEVIDVVLDHSLLTTQPGTATAVKAKVVPNRRFLRGEPKSHPFQVVVRPLDGDDQLEPHSADAVMVQKPLLAKWLLKAILIAVAGVIALVVAWFALLKPAVETAAKEQAELEVAEAGEAAAQANEAASAANEAASKANAAAGDSTGGGADAEGAGADGSGSGSGADGTAGAAGSTPVSFRIQAQSPAVTDGAFERFRYVAPDGQTIDIGDVVLQNPRADSGFIRISIGDDIVLEVGLANFRDLDYHYVVPLHVDPDQPVVLSVNCVAPGSGGSACSPSASFSGRLGKPVPTTSPAPAGG